MKDSTGEKRRETMTATELAKELGLAIKNDEVLLNYDKAKAAYESNDALQEKIRVYNAQRAALTEEFDKDIDKQDKTVIESIKKSMDDLGRDITAYEEYTAFAAAQKAVNDFMTLINQTITYHAFGIEPSSCTHDCSTCSGCH